MPAVRAAGSTTSFWQFVRTRTCLRATQIGSAYDRLVELRDRLKVSLNIVIVATGPLARSESVVPISGMAREERDGMSLTIRASGRLDEMDVRCHAELKSWREKRRTQMFLTSRRSRSSEEMETQWHANVKLRGERGRNEMLHK